MNSKQFYVECVIAMSTYVFIVERRNMFHFSLLL